MPIKKISLYIKYGGITFFHKQFLRVIVKLSYISCVNIFSFINSVLQLIVEIT